MLRRLRIKSNLSDRIFRPRKGNPNEKVEANNQGDHSLRDSEGLSLVEACRRHKNQHTDLPVLGNKVLIIEPFHSL